MRLPKFLTKNNPAWRAWFAVFGTTPGPVWKTTDKAALITEGYNKCAPAHACVSMIAKSGGGVRWTLKKGDQEFDRHDLLTRLARPNKYESGSRFVENVFSYLLVTGDSYIYRNSGIDSAPPDNLYWLRPDRMTVRKSGDWKNPIVGYDYSAGSTPQFMPEALVLHLAETNLGGPDADWYGLSRIEVLAHEIDTWNESVKWNMKRLQNDMRPPGVVTGKSIVDMDKLKEMWRERYQGAENAGIPVFIEGEGITWQDISASAKDSDWTEGQKRVLRSICSVLGVPSQLLGDTEATTYANYQEARKAFWHETMLPLLDFYRDELQNWLVPLYGSGLTLDYDRDAIEALQEGRGTKYAYLDAAKFLTTNEKREAAGYDSIGPEGDEVMVGMGDMPLSEAVLPAGDAAPPIKDPKKDPAAAGEDDDDDEEAPAKSFKPCQAKSLGSFWRGETERKALWRNFERRIAIKERAFARELKAWLAAQGQAASAMVPSGFAEAQFRADSEASYKSKFSARYARLYGTALAAGRTMTEGKLYEFEEGKAVEDIPGPLRAKLEKLIADAAKVITDETVKEIQAVLSEATGTNLTTQEIGYALRDKVEGLSGVRSRRIARTETAMLENAGNMDGFKENEFVNRKGWLCSFVPASRDAHEKLSGTEIGIDDLFTMEAEGKNGKSFQLAYPGDRSNGAEGIAVINCLCALYPVVA